MKLFRKLLLPSMALGMVPAMVLGASVGSAGASTASIPTVAENPSLAAAVPSSIKAAGTLTVAMDATYAPDEFVASNGTTIVGMDADLADAIGQVLGL
jgi:polar amino acid transport system substrate-binding protein